MRYIPTVLTLIRLFASPLLVWLLLIGRFRESLVVVLLAGVTDWFDGFAARKLKVSGKAGVLLDPLADKVMLVTLFVTLTAVGLLPVWMLVLTIGRDLVIVIGALLLRLLRGYRRFLPSTMGKVSTFFQIVLVFLVVTRAAYPSRFLSVLEILAIVLSTIFTVWSGADYVRLGIKMTRRPAQP